MCDSRNMKKNIVKIIILAIILIIIAIYSVVFLTKRNTVPFEIETQPFYCEGVLNNV